MEGAEDRTVGKCMYEMGVKPAHLLSGAATGKWKGESCQELGVLMKEHGALHAGASAGMLACWNEADLSVI